MIGGQHIGEDGKQLVRPVFDLAVTDIEIQAEELVRTKKKLTEIYVGHTGKDYDRLVADMERDRFMSPEESLDYGLVDKVVEFRKDSNKGND